MKVVQEVKTLIFLQIIKKIVSIFNLVHKLLLDAKYFIMFSCTYIMFPLSFSGQAFSFSHESRKSLIYKQKLETLKTTRQL